jgi:hypothetical protein
LNEPHAQLLHVAHAARFTGILSRTSKYREQNRRQKRYYGYDDKQLDKSESGVEGIPTPVLMIVSLLHNF